jgi:recombination protein RecA
MFKSSGPNVISSGFSELDKALGIGGIPRGRIIELSGPNDSFKTMFILNMIANMQKQEIITAFIDVDRDLSEYYLESAGIDSKSLTILYLSNDFEIIETVKKIVREKVFDLIVIDSAGFINPAKGQRITAMFKHMLSQLSSIIYGTECSILFVNQLRNPKDPAEEKVPLCNNIFDIYASIRLRVHDIDRDKNLIDINIVKNKLWHQLDRIMLNLA